MFVGSENETGKREKGKGKSGGKLAKNFKKRVGEETQIIMESKKGEEEWLSVLSERASSGVVCSIPIKSTFMEGVD